jgi:iron complex transport system substrate-binding protein
VSALGLGDDLVGVTHECDWPAEATTKQAVTRSGLPALAGPAEIDRLVSASVEGGEPVYTLDTDAMRELRPDLVLTQDLCAVCAVPAGHVQAALDVLGCPASVISLDPGSLGETLDCIQRVGDATGTGPRATRLVETLRQRLAAVRAAVSGAGQPATFALEWGDPPFNGGHWVPEMIRTAGGEPVLGADRSPSIRLTWQEIGAAAPEVVVFMPCGYGLDEAVREGRSLLGREELAGAREMFAVDASAYFSRPGPRLVDGVEILAGVLHPGSVPEPPAGAVARLR